MRNTVRINLESRLRYILFSCCALSAGFVFISDARAQNAPLEGISESTDPERVRAVERRAEEIIARQQQSQSGASDAARNASGDQASDADSRAERRAQRKQQKARKLQQEGGSDMRTK